MAKPRLIILIRHAQSEGNKNRDIHQTIPDHRVKLTQEGWKQAYEAGRKLRAMLRADDTVHFFTSPYRRTRETTEGILATLTSDDPEPSAFKRNNIKVYEEPRLREQDFGNFQPCSAEMERMWQERADYGHFFYRIPNGESAADAYDRISGFNESLWRQFGEDDCASVCVLVTHGLMSRVFLMKWYHFSVEYFEDLRNVNHCEFLIMNKQESGKYILENKLRTWSALRRERAIQAAKEKETKNNDEGEVVTRPNGTSKDSSKPDKALASSSSTHNLSSSSPASPAIASPIVEKRRRWGGCPNGCNHDKNFKIRQNLADLVKSDNSISSPAAPAAATNGTSNGGPSSHADEGSVSDNNATSPLIHRDPSFCGSGEVKPLASRRPAGKRFIAQNADAEEPEEAGPQIDITKAREDVVSSPDGTPSFISVEDRLRNGLKSPGHGTHTPQDDSDDGHSHTHHHRRHHHHHLLHVGRDGGGTYSGHNSVAASDVDSSEDERHRRRRNQQLAATTTQITLRPKPSIIPSGSGATNNSRLQSGQEDSGDGDVEIDTVHNHKKSRRDHGMGRGTRANRLGDAPHSSDGEHEADAEGEPGDDEDAVDKLVRDEGGVQGSVY
ncbi:histidine phosphatase superfamily [Coniochaeta sp. 2T2.1]|nr:histidine phosphatase superfamily [Coniochaeta sp. 2T2.1]